MIELLSRKQQAANREAAANSNRRAQQTAVASAAALAADAARLKCALDAIAGDKATPATVAEVEAAAAQLAAALAPFFHHANVALRYAAMNAVPAIAN